MVSGDFLWTSGVFSRLRRCTFSSVGPFCLEGAQWTPLGGQEGCLTITCTCRSVLSSSLASLRPDPRRFCTERPALLLYNLNRVTLALRTPVASVMSRLQRRPAGFAGVGPPGRGHSRRLFPAVSALFAAYLLFSGTSRPPRLGSLHVPSPWLRCSCPGCVPGSPLSNSRSLLKGRPSARPSLTLWPPLLHDSYAVFGVCASVHWKPASPARV